MPRMTVLIFADRRQLEAHSFETVQHIDKRISDVSSRINALQNGTKLLGHRRKGCLLFFCNLGRKWANEK